MSVPEAVRHHAWKAQLRLCTRFARLSSRGVQVNKICVAVARELAGFVWAIADQVPAPLLPPHCIEYSTASGLR